MQVRKLSRLALLLLLSVSTVQADEGGTQRWVSFSHRDEATQLIGQLKCSGESCGRVMEALRELGDHIGDDGTPALFGLGLGRGSETELKISTPSGEEITHVGVGGGGCVQVNSASSISSDPGKDQVNDFEGENSEEEQPVNLDGICGVLSVLQSLRLVFKEIEEGEAIGSDGSWKREFLAKAKRASGAPLQFGTTRPEQVDIYDEFLGNKKCKNTELEFPSDAKGIKKMCWELQAMVQEGQDCILRAEGKPWSHAMPVRSVGVGSNLCSVTVLDTLPQGLHGKGAPANPGKQKWVVSEGTEKGTTKAYCVEGDNFQSKLAAQSHKWGGASVYCCKAVEEE